MRHFGLVVLLLTLTGSAFAGQTPVEPITPITTAQEPPLASSSQQEERLEQMLQVMERLQQTLGGQTEQTLSALKTIQKEAQDVKASIHALEERQESVTKLVNNAKSQAESITDRNLGLINSGFTALGAVAAILALAGIGVTYFSTQTYREQIKNKKDAFDKYEAEIGQLIERAKEKVDLLSDEVSRQGLTPNYSKDILSRAQEAVKSGKGIEVLWGKAILAQEKKQWEKAYTFWKTILEDSPRNENALFGLAVACGNLARESSKNTTEKKNLLEEGIHNLKKISDAMQNPNVLCNWGTLLFTRAAAASSPEAKNAFWDDAQKKYRRATKENEHLAEAWFNWGNLLSARAAAASSPEEKNAFWDDAQEKYRRATKENEHLAEAWFNWGTLLSARADAASSPEEKNALWDEAETKYIQSSSIEPALPAYNQACLAALRNGPLKDILHYLNISLEGEKLPSLCHMQNDSELDTIRDIPEFKTFIEKVRALDRPIDKV